LHRNLKRNLVIGGAVVVVAAFAGGAYAATQNSGPTTRQAFLNDVAKRLHVSPQQLSSALNGAYLDQLQAEVKTGRLTQAQANALAQRFKQNGSAVPAVPFGPFGPGGPRAFRVFPGGPRAFPAPGRFGGLGLIVGPGAVPAAASYLGLTNQQLLQQLASGKSLAQIAASKGKSASGLEQAMSTAVKTKLDKLVASKMITSAEEQQILSRLTARLSAQINRKGLPFRQVVPPGLRFRKGGSLPAPPNFKLPAPQYMPVPPSNAPAPVHPALPAPAVPVPSA
jgi:hypothetical protein